MGKKSRKTKPKSSGAGGAGGNRRPQSQRAPPPPPLVKVITKKNFREVPPRMCIDQIKEGHVGIILDVASMVRTNPADVEYRIKLLEAGVVDALVEVLSRCHEEGMHDLVEKGVPSQWMMVLAALMNPPACETIFDGLSPVFRCLLDSNDRTFFNSNLQWYMSQYFFVAIIGSAVEISNFDVIPLLLKYDDLIEFVVQALFWKTKRPDIVREVLVRFNDWPGQADEYFSNLRNVAVDALSRIVTGCLIVVKEENAQYFVQDFGEEAVNRMARSSVVSSEYDCTNDEVFVASLFDVLPTVSIEKKSLLWEIQNIFSQSECVDKRVIIQCMKYAWSVTSDFEETKRVACYLKLTLFPLSSLPLASGKQKEHLGRFPRDSRYAIAIGSGLLELCMDLLLRFGMHKDLFDIISDVIQGANTLAFVPKTAKSIAEQRHSLKHFIESRSHAIDELDDECRACVDAIERMATSSKSSDASSWQRLLAGTHCMNCDKQLEKKEAKKCSGCKVASYCGKECQRENWRHHKGSCGGLALTAGLGLKHSTIQAGQLQNVGLRTVMEYLINILLQAEIQGVSLVDDCIVFVDLGGIRPKVKVMVDDDFFVMVKSRDGRDFVNGRENVKKMRAGGGIACAFEAFAKNACKLITMSLLPPSLTRLKSWKEAQATLGRSSVCVEIFSRCKHDHKYKKTKLEELETKVCHMAEANAIE